MIIVGKVLKWNVKALHSLLWSGKYFSAKGSDEIYKLPDNANAQRIWNEAIYEPVLSLIVPNTAKALDMLTAVARKVNPIQLLRSCNGM